MCENIDWSNVYNQTDTQLGYNLLESQVKEISNTVAPLWKVVISEQHPISNHTLRSLENCRNTLYMKMKKRKTSKAIEEYKLIKKKIKVKVQAVNKAETSKMFQKRTTKDIWKGVNTLCGRNPSKSNKCTLLDPETGKTTADKEKCANIFASAFQSKVANLTEKVGCKDPLLEEISPKIENQKDTPAPQFTTAEIVQTVKNMKNSSSLGPDGISIKYIKDCAEPLAPVLKFLFDKIALFAKMPEQWKTAKITPIHKKGSKENPENFRPISLLCSLGKVFEKCMLNFMTNNYGHSLPSNFQHGFRSKHSTTTAALTVQNHIAKALENKKKVIVVSTDMSAAFDLLDKDVLIPRMQKLGFPQSICNIYTDFLSNRKAYVECNGVKSKLFNLLLGCVQGSPSGPYLFSLLVDGLSEHMSSVNIVAYADDMYFIYEGDTWEQVSATASEQTQKAMDWLRKTGMVLNASKTEACYFSMCTLSNPPKINISGELIECQKSIRVLGLLFDHKMSWETHIDKVLKEANSRTQAVKHFCKYLSKSENLSIAHGLFFSTFYYGSCVWLTETLSKSLMHRLTVASNACLRAAFGYKIQDISTEDLHKEANMLTPYQRSYQDKIILFWRIVNSCEPYDLFMDLITQGQHLSRTSTFHMQLVASSKAGTFSFSNRLNDSLSLMGDKFLDMSEYAMKKTTKNIISSLVPAKK